MEDPVISVVIAAHNESLLIGSCLQALAQQDRAPPFEVIVVDDGSMDDTATIAEAYACIVHRRPHRGQLHAKSFGLAQCRSRLVAILDADCRAGPGWVAEIAAALHPSRIGGNVAVTCCYDYGDLLPGWAKAYNRIMHGLIMAPAILLKRSLPFVAGGNVAFVSSALPARFGYPLSGGIAATEISLGRMLSRSGTVTYLPTMQVVSSSRRFQAGPKTFFWNYKVHQYWWPLIRSWLNLERMAHDHAG